MLHALLKLYIVERLRNAENGMIVGEDIADLLTKFGLTEDIVSRTKFHRALRSLHYNDEEVFLLRPRTAEDSGMSAYDQEPRRFRVVLR